MIKKINLKSKAKINLFAEQNSSIGCWDNWTGENFDVQTIFALKFKVNYLSIFLNLSLILSIDPPAASPPLTLANVGCCLRFSLIFSQKYAQYERYKPAIENITHCYFSGVTVIAA